MPCVAAFAATKRELRSWPQAILTVMFQTGMAYLVAFVIYQLDNCYYRRIKMEENYQTLLRMKENQLIKALKKIRCHV